MVKREILVGFTLAVMMAFCLFGGILAEAAIDEEYVRQLEQRIERLETIVQEQNVSIGKLLLASYKVKNSPADFIDALAKKQTDVVNAFLLAGMNSNTTTNDGIPALIAAIIMDSPEIANMLLEAGANANIIATNGMPCLIFAAMKGKRGYAIDYGGVGITDGYCCVPFEQRR